MLTSSSNMEALDENANVKLNIYGIDVILPVEDTKGQEFLGKLSNRLEELNFGKAEKILIQNALRVAKAWGTEELKNNPEVIAFEKEYNRIFGFQRNSGSSIMAHALESASNQSEKFSKDFDKTKHAELIAASLCHDSVEDSKGLYGFNDLENNLEKNGASQESVKSIIDIVDSLTISEEEQKRDRVGKTNQKKLINGEELEEGAKIVDFGMTDVVTKLFKDVYVEGDWKNTSEYAEINNLEEEYAKKYAEYYRLEAKKISGDDFSEDEWIKRNDKLFEMSSIEDKMRQKFDEFLVKNIDRDNITKEDLYKVTTRLTETVTALGEKDIRGFREGDYGIRNLSGKRVFYSGLYDCLDENIKEDLGEKTYDDLGKDIVNYSMIAEEFQQDKLHGGRASFLEDTTKKIVEGLIKK